eukprot:TRINITY_DN1961_c0_g1_i4.p1 TRINITY_DN1961_c0_g1~~TRINITY_DN1961_c0_g1_i4.p1  ORF type:complete len:1238 (-),score=451.42 TRINITY_DN1961_c0_g1_i4:200-3913(-)
MCIRDRRRVRGIQCAVQCRSNPDQPHPHNLGNTQTGAPSGKNPHISSVTSRPVGASPETRRKTPTRDTAHLGHRTMTVEIDRGLGDWLVRSNVFGPAASRRARANPDTHLEFDAKVAEALNDGTAICRLLRYLAPDNIKVPNPSILKASSKPADRLHNWNILSKALAQFKVDLDSDMKNLIVNGDLDIVLELVAELRQKFSNGKSAVSSRRGSSHNNNNNNNSNDQQVSLDLKFLDSCREVDQASNALEFLVIVMIVKLGLHAKQAAALLTANTKYLTHMLEKGVSGKFDFAAPFYSYILQHTSLLASHLQANTATVPYILNIFVATFNSAHEESTQWVSRIFVRLAALLTSSGHGQLLQTWLTQPHEHLAAILGCFSRHPGAHDAIVLVLIELSQSSLLEVLTKHSASMLSALDLSSLVATTLSSLQQQKRRHVDPASIAPSLLSTAVKKAIDSKDPNDRLECMSKLLALFEQTPDSEAVVDSSAAVKSMLELIKKVSRDDNSSQGALQALLRLFDAVAGGAKGGVGAATTVVVWKALIFGIFERRPGDESLQALTSGLAERLNQHKDLAPTLIVEPLSKQIAVHGTANLDFEFLSAVANHPKLSTNLGRTLLDVLSKIYADGDDMTMVNVQPVLFGLVKRYQSDASTIHSCGKVSSDALLAVQPSYQPSSQRISATCALLTEISKLTRQHAETVRSALQQCDLPLLQSHPPLEELLESLGGKASANPMGHSSTAVAAAVTDTVQPRRGSKPEPPQQAGKRNNPRNDRILQQQEAADKPNLGPRARREKEMEEQRLKEAAAEKKRRENMLPEEVEIMAKKKHQAKMLLEQRKKREDEIKTIIENKQKKLQQQKQLEKDKRAKSAEAKNRLARARQRDRKLFLAKKAEKAEREAELAKDPSRSVVASAPAQMNSNSSPNRRRNQVDRAHPFWENERVAHINHVIQKYPHGKRQDVKEVADMVYDIIHVAIHGPKPPHIEPPKDKHERQLRIAKFNNPDPSRALLTKLEAASGGDKSPEHADMLQDERKRLARAERLHVKLAEYEKEKKLEADRLAEAERVYEEIKKTKQAQKEAREKARRESEKAKIAEWRSQRDEESTREKRRAASKHRQAEKEKQRLNAEYMNKKAERQSKVKVQVETIEHKDDNAEAEAKKKAAAEKKKAMAAEKKRAAVAKKKEEAAAAAAAKEEEEAAVADEEAAVADEEAAVADQEAAVADEEAAVADEEAAVADEVTMLT